MTRVGVISDTHGLLRPEPLDSLAGFDPQIEAIGRQIQPLRRIAVAGMTD